MLELAVQGAKAVCGAVGSHGRQQAQRAQQAQREGAAASAGVQAWPCRVSRRARRQSMQRAAPARGGPSRPPLHPIALHTPYTVLCHYPTSPCTTPTPSPPTSPAPSPTYCNPHKVEQVLWEQAPPLVGRRQRRQQRLCEVVNASQDSQQQQRGPAEGGGPQEAHWAVDWGGRTGKGGGGGQWSAAGVPWRCT